ncbi:nicotinate phosphoribosyltransferase [Umbelopsis sp. AD052]|nr:nicotinate phosphoribosyltransferase [Umbelopsis sp. AD052]
MSNHTELPVGLASILDSDLYKFSMQQVVFKSYPTARVSYKFTNRTKSMQLNQQAVDWLSEQIQRLENLKLKDDEYQYLSQLPFIDQDYLDYLKAFTFKPEEQVHFHFDPQTRDFDLNVTGLWLDTILYEVPLLALISESYFLFVDTDWNHEGQYENAYKKAEALLSNGCKFSEFGTRRRRDMQTQDTIMHAMLDAEKEYVKKCEEQGENPKGCVSGTSNVSLAKKYNIMPIGTVAHEFFMGISALEGIENANKKALARWLDIYKGALGIALTDTFRTEVFFRDFDHDLAKAYTGVRQDSGDPLKFADAMVNHYHKVGIDPSTKVIVFSDALDVNKAIQLQDYCIKAGVNSSFGIGTHFTNDFKKISNPSQRSEPMNMVIKMNSCNGTPVIKLSDDVLKNSGDSDLVSKIKTKLGLQD